MNVPRFWPAAHVLGRTIACNRSDKWQQNSRLCNQGTNNLIPPNGNNGKFLNANLEDRLLHQQNLLHTGRGSYLKIISKSFSTGVQLFCREFTDGENEYAHDILCSLPAYKATTLNAKLYNISHVNTFSLLTYQDKFWPSVSNNELVSTFWSVSNVLSICESADDQQFKSLFNCIIQRIPTMTDNQMLAVLSALSYWPQIFCNSSTSFEAMWKTLDKCCVERLSVWDISKIFLAADHWYALRITRVSLFFSKLILKLGAQIMKLSPTQFVQFMFYANLYRELMAKNNDLQQMIKWSLNFISIEEMGIIAMALFKTQTAITDGNLIENIMKFTVKNFDVISDHSLGSILKLVGKNFPSDGHMQCYNFLESLHTYLHKFNNFVHLQVAIFGSNLLVFHEKVFHKVSQRFANEMPSLRLKDIERFTYSLMLYQYVPSDCPNILNLIMNELRKPERIVEINHFPRSFASCISYLVAMGVFPHDLISGALQPSMIQVFRDNIYDPSDHEGLGRELNEIDWSIKVELPHTYIGFTLPPEISKLLTKRFMGKVPSHSWKNLTHQERFFLDVQTKLAAMIGSVGNVEAAIILPHFSHPDLIFCTTREGEPVKVPEEFKNVPFCELKPVTELNHLDLLWNAVMVGGRNSMIKQTNQLKGNLLMKKRQLAKLGYKVSVVPYVGYIKSSMKYKLLFLEQCLKDSTLNLKGRKEMGLLSLKGTTEPSQFNVTEDAKLESIMQRCSLEEIKETANAYG